ncbi:hypothetical protein [Streptomyces sp. 8N616]|uniref:hypothetical protein n=1 Tax=Streptomyces sp. 8N616 TaxID=3457414 RepID=UPI003FD69E2C
MAAAHEVTVPSQDRLRGDDQLQLPQSDTREPVEQRGKESAVRRSDTRPIDLTLWDNQLVAQRQYPMTLSILLIDSSRIKENTLDTTR